MKNMLQALVASTALFSASQVWAEDPSFHRPVASPDGTSLIFMMQGDETGGDWELFQMPLEGDGRKIRLTHHQGWDGYAVFAPDGRHIVFDRSRDGSTENKAPHFLDLDTGNARQIVSPSGWLSVSGWREDSLLAFWERDGQRDLYLLNLKGEIKEALTQTPDRSEHDAHFSPDGHSIAFASSPATGDGETTLETISLLTRERQVLHRSKGRIYGVAWAPDGSRLAFTDAPGGGDDDADVFVYDLASGKISACTTNDAWDHMPEWMPDGKKLLFTSYRSGKERIYLTDCEETVIELRIPKG
ncbi:TolB family protein [Kordiimonas sp.]|uniref:TolB family protein n=1 Tax=Kordiimonas sp. TaxID=1970157 RepID=UPI003A9457BE